MLFRPGRRELVYNTDFKRNSIIDSVRNAGFVFIAGPVTYIVRQWHVENALLVSLSKHALLVNKLE